MVEKVVEKVGVADSVVVEGLGVVDLRVADSVDSDT